MLRWADSLNNGQHGNEMMITTYKVPDIECDGCANSIKKALATQRGVQSVSVAVDEKTVTVEHDENQIDSKHLAELLDDIGFPTD